MNIFLELFSLFFEKIKHIFISICIGGLSNTRTNSNSFLTNNITWTTLPTNSFWQTIKMKNLLAFKIPNLMSAPLDLRPSV